MAISQRDASGQYKEKEKCLGCDKFISTHHQIVTSNSCQIIMYAKCAKSLFEINGVAYSWNCWQCLSIPPKYNPFSEFSYHRYDPNSLEGINDLFEISKI